jgi:anti-sigma factor RsiW
LPAKISAAKIMACDQWTEKLDAYFDGELPAGEARAVAEHLRGCAACAADGLARVQQKLAVRDAGLRFTPNAAFRERVRGFRRSGCGFQFWQLPSQC